MANSYRPVQWNRQKKTYDKLLWAGILLSLTSFAVFELIFAPGVTIETLLIRATAFTAIILLHIILLIGPLSRLDKRFLPLLYNRRHMGVSMFILAAVHGIVSMVQFHALGDTNPLVSVFTANQNYREISEFPFQILGFGALSILFVMAATSHDFWLKNLSPRIWKLLHMLVYVAYALLIGHIALGTLQYEDHLFYKVLLIGGFLLISGLHLYTGWLSSWGLGLQAGSVAEEGYHRVARIEEIPDNRAKMVVVEGENIAVFKYDGKLSAVNNVCRHQLGPLGEGQIIDGCITCPWHGYQYLPGNGQSPPPYEEKLPTYQLRLVGDEVWVNPTPFPAGTAVEPLSYRS